MTTRTGARPWAALAALAVAGLLLSACAATAAAGQARDVRDAAPAHAAEQAHTAAQAPVVTRASAVSGTVRHTFDPYRADGTLRTPVARSVHGSCWTTSLAAPGTHTFRCLSGNNILDPCFAKTASATSVACVATPWSRAVVLHLTKRLPKPITGGHGRIWAMTLSTGAGCVAATGTAAYVHGQNLSYDCPDGNAEIIAPHARSMTAYYARTGGTALHRHAVRAVWRA